MEDHGVAVIVKKRDKFLLLEDSRKLMLGFWGPPHGRCKPKDLTEERSVIREVFEETNLRVKPIKKLWTTKADTKVKTVSFWLASTENGKLKIDKSESLSYGWFGVQETLKSKLYPGTKKFFNLVKKGRIKIWSVRLDFLG